MASTFNKFQPFVADIANKIYNLGSDQLVVALSDVAPTATNHILSDITQISYTNLSSRNIATTSSIQTSGTYNLILQNLMLTASGTVPQFRYIIIYDSTTPSGNLIGWYDNGSEVNLVNGQTITFSFDQTNGLISIA